MPEDSGRTAEGDLFRSISEDLKNGRLEPIEEDESPKHCLVCCPPMHVDQEVQPQSSSHGASEIQAPSEQPFLFLLFLFLFQENI